MHDNPHYLAVSKFYGDRCAKRSGLPYINHIDEGLFLLQSLGAPQDAMEAYCLHPMVQGDADLAASLKVDSVFLSEPLELLPAVLAMEYRQVANAYLSHHCSTDSDSIRLSPIPSVNIMLQADKIQNRKDFELYHQNSHPKATNLELYFRNWLQALEISEESYQKFSTELRMRFPRTNRAEHDVRNE